MNSIMHLDTPSLAVSDSRGLPVRSVQFYRAFDGQRIETRVTQQYFDMAGRPIASRDPRFFSRLNYDAHAPVNLKQTVSLSGAVLLSESVDAGWQLSLHGQAGHLLESHDGRGTQRRIEYDALLRPSSINESGRTAERFAYGGPAAAERNQCNQLIRHDDTAGARFLPDYGVFGAALTECRQFLQAHDAPDWPLAEHDRDALLETGVSTTRTGFNALGETTRQTDAANNVQVFGQTVGGQLKTVELTLAGAAQPQTLVSAIDYSASGHVVQETAGNGATSVYHYDLQDDRLVELGTTLTSGRVLQRLHYTYDPVGNVVKIEDRAQAITHCNNQSTAPINGYAYDTLYQLINATGREVRNNPGRGPALPDLQPLPLDPNRLAHYEQSYYYDAGGNLLTLCHDGAQSFTRHMRVSPDSNRSLPEDEFNPGLPESFDASGNLLNLVRGQPLRWDVRNQLQQITFIRRADGPNDDECYSYDGQGQRCRKISTSQASGRTLTHEVRYLPGLEIRTTAGDETLHVISAQAGRNSVRVLHWEAGKPGAIANDQVRYSLSDHLGSSTLELDQQGALISHESYYPFGGTACWAARSAVEAKYKTVRYSGKERDASGLYYYGFRYYAPWLQRWINPDPAGAVDGVNLYRFVGNAPVIMVDRTGLIGERSNAAKQAAEASKLHFDTYVQPRIMARREKDKESAIESLKERTGAVYAGSVGERLDAVSAVLETAPMTFNIRPEKLGRLQGEGMVNTWQTLKKENSYTLMRDRFENQMFEYEKSSSALTRQSALKGKQKGKGDHRPLYGALQIAKDNNAVGGAPTYGRTAFHLSDQARSYMTFTGADSLSTGASMNNLASARNVFPLIRDMRADTWEALNENMSGQEITVPISESSNYIEWQSHAPVKWRDMKFLKFEKFSDLDTARSDPSTVAFFKKNAIPVRLYSI